LVWTAGLDSAHWVTGRFQSLGRDSVGLDHRRLQVQLQVEMFQSLGRDSVGLDSARGRLTAGCWAFQSLGRDSVGLDQRPQNPEVQILTVSIPRSGFCWFGPVPLDIRQGSLTGFNPSVGILLVWTSARKPASSA